MSKDDKKRAFATRAIHAGQAPDPTTGAIMTPIFQTSTYVQPSPGKHTGYEYARTHNPTREAMEGCIAALEKAKYGVAFASGCATSDAIMHQLKVGDRVSVAVMRFVKEYTRSRSDREKLPLALSPGTVDCLSRLLVIARDDAITPDRPVAGPDDRNSRVLREF